MWPCDRRLQRRLVLLFACQLKQWPPRFPCAQYAFWSWDCWQWTGISVQHRLKSRLRRTFFWGSAMLSTWPLAFCVASTAAYCGSIPGQGRSKWFQAYVTIMTYIVGALLHFQEPASAAVRFCMSGDIVSVARVDEGLILGGYSYSHIFLSVEESQGYVVMMICICKALLSHYGPWMLLRCCNKCNYAENGQRAWTGKCRPMQVFVFDWLSHEVLTHYLLYLGLSADLLYANLSLLLQVLTCFIHVLQRGQLINSTIALYMLCTVVFR